MHKRIIVGVLTVTLVLVLGATARSDWAGGCYTDPSERRTRISGFDERSHKLWQESVHGGVDEPGGRGTPAD